MVKTIAQIRRMAKRATERGEEYNYEQPEKKSEEPVTSPQQDTPDATASPVDDADAAASPVDNAQTAKLEATASKLKKELEEIEKNESVKAKDRRSAKRKAEAIAAQETGMPATELLEWYEKHLKSKPEKKNESKASKKTKEEDGKPNNPYIAFFGQLSFDTTHDGLFEHIRKGMKDDDWKVTKENTKIRMLTDAKTKKSRGMAFVEVDDPEYLYALLKLHRTFLDGRRLNVERSAGGKNEAKKAKITQYRKEQETHVGEVVDKMLGEYKKTGELRDDELDAGVISLCKRHSPTIVQAALDKYIEGSGRDMDNPSAYLTFLISKFAEEGIFEPKDSKGGKGGDGFKRQPHTEGPRKKKRDSSEGPRKPRDSSEGPRKPRDSSEGPKKKFKPSTDFKQAGVDMSISDGGSKDLSKIFPSATRGGRGRGRGGRGYMRG